MAVNEMGQMDGSEKKIKHIAALASDLADALRDLDGTADRRNVSHRSHSRSSKEKNGRNTSVLANGQGEGIDLGTSSSSSGVQSYTRGISIPLAGGRFEITGYWFRRIAWVLVTIITIIHVVSKL